MSRLDALPQPGWPAERDHEAEERALQRRLARIQVACRSHGRRAMIVLEGWDAAGKGGLIRRLTAELDPRFCHVHSIAAPEAHDAARHFLYRFWTRAPGRGEWAVFDRSWYGRVAVERVEGFCTPAEWRRAYDEINAFEAQHLADGTSVVKLFLHVSQEEQNRRLLDRLRQPWKRWKVGAEDFRNRARRDDYLAAYEEMFARTDTPTAPWRLIAADSKKQARVSGLTAVADALEQGLDMGSPALDPALKRLAERELGIKL